jgi:CrcB protein
VNLLDILPVALIAAGGAIGSVARYLLSTFVLRVSGSLFPFGTFAVNLLGCIAFGLIAGAADQRVPLGSAPRAFLLVGVLGGFTTFSSYAFESFWLLRDGHIAAASLNVVGQVVAGMLGVWMGFSLGR